MSRRQRSIGLLLGSLSVLALLAPASSLADEQDTTTVPAPLETTTTQAPAPATSETSPAPAPSAPEVASAPQVQVQAQHAQGSTRAAPTRRHSAAGAQPQAEAHGEGKTESTGGAAPGAVRAGKAAPAPSSLTPPLPFSLSSSLDGVPGLLHRKLPRSPVPAADLSGCR